MQLKNIVVMEMLFILLLVNTVLIASDSQVSDPYAKEFKKDHARFKSLWKIKDVNAVKQAAEEIQNKWSQRNKKYYAQLMLEVCKPLSSGRLKSKWQYNLARKYALLALSEPNEISIETELELIGHVMTDMTTRYSPKDQEWTERRKKDVEVRLHAWHRLEKAINPNWDQNDYKLLIHPRPPESVPWISGNPPEAIKDPKIRAEYKAALKDFNNKVEHYNKQLRLRRLKKLSLANAERYIIRAYSKPPFNLQELKQYLDKYIADKKTKDKMLDAVKKNMDKQTKDTPEGSKQQNR